MGIHTKHHRLTERQIEVLKLLTKGYTNSEIAKELFITVHTVKAHICEIYEALEVHSRVQVVTTAIKNNIITEEDF